MRLTKDFHERLQAEALSKIDTEIRSAIRKASEIISGDRSYYLDKSEIKLLEKISRTLYDEWIPKESEIKIPKAFLPVSFREWNKLNKPRDWFRRVFDDHIDIRIKDVAIPIKKKQNLVCLKSVDKLFDPIFKKLLEREELKKILDHAEMTCTNPKRLRQVLVGIDKLAPNMMKDVDVKPSNLPVIAYNVEKFLAT